ncbi:hypothetical protein FSP39_005166 [Pinctada imbricata]|uniref:Sulfatase N-terminal domain-containing protein n=1 Tax=Pinctada imbricata TaxID=66713 RepID=A0AA88XKK0_PINIB|nr:hypothetical protein FSP39_005166 [Pinctada imbricata]
MQNFAFCTIFVFSCLIIGLNARKNVLFLVSDDMRPELTSFYGPDFPSPIHPPMHSPNLDRLASSSLLLKHAYVQQAVCSPSRTSLLTGRRPDTTHVYDLVKYFRKVGGNFTTIPQFFKMNGYKSIGMGKIFHPGVASAFDDPISWTQAYYHAPNLGYWDAKEKSWIAVPEDQWKKRPLPDAQIADRAISTLKSVAEDAKSGKQNFFVAVGFHKPHLPFVFPESMLVNYPESAIALPDNAYAPDGMPPVAWSNYEELLSYKDIAALHATGKINSSLPNSVVLDLRRAYYSALSWTDFQLGRVLDELESLGLANNTIVSFWGDHGWQLGEHGEWCKHTNFEIATHAPMMIRIPGLTDNGVVTEQLTEYVDLFPTLVEAAELGLKLDLCPEDSKNIQLCTEGESLIPLIKEPTKPWKSAAFSQYPRDGSRIMGYTIRTRDYRYTEWAEFSGPPKYKPNWDNLVGRELYNHDHTSPDILEENKNLVFDPKYQTIVKTLSKQLRAGWRNALPPSS